MTTFKNNSKYAEVLFTYLDLAWRKEIPLEIEEVLTSFNWRFKGGSLMEASRATRLTPQTSSDVYPDGFSADIAKEGPEGRNMVALKRVLERRVRTQKVRLRSMIARVGTYQVLMSDFGVSQAPRKITIGMRSIYFMFSLVWEWARTVKLDSEWSNLRKFSRELLIGSCLPSMVDMLSVSENDHLCNDMLSDSRVPGLMRAILQIKTLIREMGSRTTRTLARGMGIQVRKAWEEREAQGKTPRMKDLQTNTRFLTLPLGPIQVRVTQEVIAYGTGEHRFALGRSDIERLHQVLMSAASALVGVVVQASVGTAAQKKSARYAVQVADSNITRICVSAKRVPLGDEVLVCKGYRRAYTAHLGWLAGPLCREEYAELVAEAESTAPVGVLDVAGFLADLKKLDAASSLNAAKVFKICPAPDVSPGTAMMDRIKQIGDGNTVDKEMIVEFETELRTQILRAYIRAYHGRLKLRPECSGVRPTWFSSYLTGEMDQVPSAEIHTYLAWEGTGEMPMMSKYDPTHWKDSGLGADTIWQTTNAPNLGFKKNMLTRLIFDDECPMPGEEKLNDDHVIKMFIKAEGHKDPARAIFSANLRDRQAQSWMEKGVEHVAIRHPSFMIGQEVDVREARTLELIRRPMGIDEIALYYSFDISGWSAKMPAEPQRISHKIWETIYGGHLFSRAREINEGAHIYLEMDGYWGWYKNTHSNLEGFNGKEMTMILIALLSLSVRRWRSKVVEQGVMTERESNGVSALLFAYIDDGLSRIDLPRKHAVEAFRIYKETVIETFSKCGFSVEVSKCFPSDRFAIFLNEVYLAGRHVVHGVRAAMGISAEPTERHTSLLERVTSVATGCRGAVMAGLSAQSAVMLMGYHIYMHLLEWTQERDAVILSIWCLSPRTWGGLGIPNLMQMFVSGSGAAFEEGVATIQSYAKLSVPARRYFSSMVKTALEDRTSVSILTAPLSGRVPEGYMTDNGVSIAVRKAMSVKKEEGRLSTYAQRLLTYADGLEFQRYAESIIPMGSTEVIQEQMLVNLREAHPHSIFSAFAKRLEKSNTVMSIVGRELFNEITLRNRTEARMSCDLVRLRIR